MNKVSRTEGFRLKLARFRGHFPLSGEDTVSPVKLSNRPCVAVTGIVLIAVAVPEAIAGAAYAATVGGIAQGLGIAGAVAGAMSIVGCPQ